MEKDSQSDMGALENASSNQARCESCSKRADKELFACSNDNNKTTHYYCFECRYKRNEAIENQTKDVNYPRGILFGLAGAIIGGALWVLFTVFTHYQVAYIGIGLGFLIGYGVHRGSGEKNGIFLQIFSGIIAVIGIFFVHYFIMNILLNADMQSNPSEYPGVTTVAFEWLPFFEGPFLESFFISKVGFIAYLLAIFVAFMCCKKDKKFEAKNTI